MRHTTLMLPLAVICSFFAHAEPVILREQIIDDILSPVVASRVARPGENLQRIADAAYGSTLTWPLVWYQNQATVSDPEKFSSGTALRVARLRVDVSDPSAKEALSEAYALAYGRYLSFGSSRSAQSRWVLRQAREAGVRFDGVSWRAALTDDEKAWLAKQAPASAAPAPTAAATAKKPSSAETRDAFLSQLIQGTPLPAAEIESWVDSFSAGPETDAILARLESEAAKPGVPPQVIFALSLHYGRLGLAEKEYSALAKAKIAADRRPDVVFNVMLVHGRMKLLEASGTYETVMTGGLSVESNLEEATITVNGLEWGQGSMARDGLDPGDYLVHATRDRYREQTVLVTVKPGKTALARVSLEPEITAAESDDEAKRQATLAAELERRQRDLIVALANIPPPPAWPRKDPYIDLRNQKASLEAQGTVFPEPYEDLAQNRRVLINQVGIGLFHVSVDGGGGANVTDSFMAPRVKSRFYPSIGASIGALTTGQTIALGRLGLHLGQPDSNFGLSVFAVGGGAFGAGNDALYGAEYGIRLRRFTLSQSTLVDPSGDLVVREIVKLSYNFW